MPLPEFNEQNLLPEGGHPASENDLEVRCVEQFPASTSRSQIFEGFLAYRARLESMGVCVAQWVDGSFVDASRLDPEDIDVVNFCDSQQINVLPEGVQPAVRELLLGGPAIKSGYRTHAFLTQMFPDGHPFANRLEERLDYWTALFTTPQRYDSEGKAPAPERGRKGFVLMTIGNPTKIPQPKPI